MDDSGRDDPGGDAGWLGEPGFAGAVSSDAVG
jgi:hypothetical protein